MESDTDNNSKAVPLEQDRGELTPVPTSDTSEHEGCVTPNAFRRDTLLDHLPSSPFEDEGDIYDGMVLSDEEGVDFEGGDDDSLSDSDEPDEEEKAAVARLTMAIQNRLAGVENKVDSDEDEMDADDESEALSTRKSLTPQHSRDDAEIPASSSMPMDSSAPNSPRSISWTRNRRSHSAGRVRPPDDARTRRAGNRSRTSSTSSRPHLIRYLRSWGNKPTHASSTQVPDDSSNLTGSFLQSASSFSGIPSDSLAGPSHRHRHSTGSIDMDDDVGSSTSEELSVDSMDSSWEFELETSAVRRPLEGEVDWDMPPLPNTYLAKTIPYLDADMADRPLTRQEADTFVWEHGLLLQAVLQLLAERDYIGVEASTESADNIWKKGPLKKQSIMVGGHKRPATKWWKVKYLELRRGNLCYYGDSGHGRKKVHLRKATTVVRESQNRGPGFVFELVVQGSPTRFWSASSDEERQSWIRAIELAMIGGDEEEREVDLTPHLEAIDTYQLSRERLHSADLLESYTAVIHTMFARGSPLQIPLLWLREHRRRRDREADPLSQPSKHLRKSKGAGKHLRVAIDEFWKKAGLIGFAVNGAVVPRNSPMATERVLGALSRAILEFDKAFEEPEADDDIAEPPSTRSGSMTELQAVSYARDIVQAVIRTSERQDLTLAVNDLLENDGMVRISLQQQDEPVQMEISFAGDDQPDDSSHVGTEVVGWLRTRRRQFSTPKWKRRFAVLSGSVLSFYEAASPYPHGLRGQTILTDATIQDAEAEGDESFVFCIVTPDERRLLSFDQESEYIEWKEAIEQALDTTVATKELRPAPISETRPLSKSIISGLKGALPDARLRGGIRVIRGATGGGIRVIRSATDGSMKVIRGAVGMLRQKSGESPMTSPASSPRRRSSVQRRPSMQILMDSTALAKREPTVQCVVQATQSYVVRESAGDDPLWMVRAKLFQAFLLSGGPSGRLARGDALIELEFLEPTLVEDNEVEASRLIESV